MPVISFLLFVFISSFTPGPNNIMAMAMAHRGLRRTVKFSMGVGSGFFIITLLCCSFFNLLLASVLPVIELPLTLLGVGYMLYLAYKILTSKDTGDSRDYREGNLFLTGALLQFVNPKGILFSITLVGTFIAPYYTSYLSYFLLSVLLGVTGFLSTFTWSLFGSILQKVIMRYRRPFNLIMTLLLVYSAFSIVVK
ncbi:LysE family translocator [Paenibacillus humicus]|uniref:LysE family translocator n=1 Tax=Paenibacillus humicus TaxID=412861 RepID=UPI003D2CEB78